MRAVRTPQGEEWIVRRRVVGRGLPRLHRVGLGGAEQIGVPDLGGFDDFPSMLLWLVLGVLLIFVVLPLLLFGIELILLGLLVAASLIGSLLLGRPWIVEATAVDGTAPTRWRVRGWRNSREMVGEVARALETTGQLHPFTERRRGRPSPSVKRSGQGRARGVVAAGGSAASAPRRKAWSAERTDRTRRPQHP